MIKYKGNKYDSIEKFDCVVLRLRHKEGGSFMTCFPVSPKDYRDSHPTEAKVDIVDLRHSVMFEIYSDWGEKYSIEIDKIHDNEIKTAIDAAKENGLIT